MFFWFFMFICDLIIPLIMIIAGRFMWKKPPRNINGFVGYRTRRSMKNADTWAFAHDYAGRLWWKIGWIMLVVSVPVHIPIYGASSDVIGVACTIVITIQCLVLIASIFPTERALKETFDENGRRRWM